MLAYIAAVGAVTTAATILMKPIMSGNRTELFIAVMGILTSPFVLALYFMQEQISSAYGFYMAFIAVACPQLAAGLVKIATCFSFEVYVLLFGAMTLVASLTKMMLTSLDVSFAVYPGLWLAFSALLCIVAVAYRSVFYQVTPLVRTPPTPIVPEERGLIVHLPRADGSAAKSLLIECSMMIP